jgi:hypothetical protein
VVDEFLGPNLVCIGDFAGEGGDLVDGVVAVEAEDGETDGVFEVCVDMLRG